MKLLPFCLVAAVVACAGGHDGGPTSPRSDSQQNSAFTVSAAVDALRAAGLDPQAAGTIQQPFFTPPAQVFRVDGGDLQLYELVSSADAAVAAAKVAPGGGSIGTTSMAWMAPPHFFRNANVIAIYIGTSAKTLAALQHVFGPQFAGQ